VDGVATDQVLRHPRPVFLPDKGREVKQASLEGGVQLLVHLPGLKFPHKALGFIREKSGSKRAQAGLVGREAFQALAGQLMYCKGIHIRSFFAVKKDGWTLLTPSTGGLYT
jgi:hypothetical protein